MAMQANYAEPKLFSGAKPAYVGFFSSNFTVQDHIPSSTRDALNPETICSFESLQTVSSFKKKEKNTETQGSVVLKNFKKDWNQRFFNFYFKSKVRTKGY